MNRRLIIGILLFAVCCSSCSLQPLTPLPEETPQDEYAIDSLPGCDNCTTRLNQDKLIELAALIRLGLFGNIHSLVVIHNDQLVFEQYFQGWTRHMRHIMMSSTKSFLSALIGMAMDRGLISGVDEPLLGFFPEYTEIENRDSRKEAITLEHVLTMSSGLSWNETSTPYAVLGSANPENDVTKMSQSEDWIKYVLDQPMSAEPGTEFVYNSGGSHLLSGILQNRTGQTAEDFCADNLFGPLGITSWQWSADPDGRSTGGWGLSVHPVNLAMLGYLFLHQGRYNGVQIVPEDWVAISTRQHITATLRDTELAYGYQWWRLSDAVAGQYLKVNDIFYTAGAGGQHVFVIPHLNLIVTTTAANFNNQADVFRAVLGWVVPAVEEAEAE
jgi:CubicO group peptidase (beta-lactamase class C family)